LAEQAGAARAEHWLRRDDMPAFHAGDEVTIASLPIGAPAAAAQVEELIACGMRSLIVTGAAGSLQPHAPIGTVVLPTSAIREEGTSHHYTPSHEPALPAPRLVALLEQALRAHGIDYVSGPTWTTDAVYREHRSKIDRYRRAGVVTVEMELSALLTIATYRGVECAGLFAVSDELHGDGWDLGFGADTFLGAMARAATVALEAARRSAAAGSPGAGPTR
ncbi:MAG: nucleoside phosphorylase, partial [Chloroflexi bacterium]|nr:nucleoside phosphorylase [Chloroflexota bacterium]